MPRSGPCSGALLPATGQQGKAGEDSPVQQTTGLPGTSDLERSCRAASDHPRQPYGGLRGGPWPPRVYSPLASLKRSGPSEKRALCGAATLTCHPGKTRKTAAPQSRGSARSGLQSSLCTLPGPACQGESRPPAHHQGPTEDAASAPCRVLKTFHHFILRHCFMKWRFCWGPAPFRYAGQLAEGPGAPWFSTCPQHRLIPHKGVPFGTKSRS